MSEEWLEFTMDSTLLSVRRGRNDRVFFVATLPPRTVLNGMDLSGAQFCPNYFLEDPDHVGTSIVAMPADSPRVVRVRDRKQPSKIHSITVDARALYQAIQRSEELSRMEAVLAQAQRLVEAGSLEGARDLIGHLLEAPAGSGPTAVRPHPTRPASCGSTLDFEGLGILPAHRLVCSCDTRSATSHVPEHFTHVAVDDGHCVSREHFEEILALARSTPPRYGGARDEHSIAYVASRLAQPFARQRDRLVCEVNGHALDMTGQISDIVGGRFSTRRPLTDGRETHVIGPACMTIDRAALISRHHLTLEQADEVADWLTRRMETDVETALALIDRAHLDGLLRSPDVVCLLAAAGVTLTNPVTGERMERVPDSPSLICDFLPPSHGELPDPHDEGALTWYALRVASDDDWRIEPSQADLLRESEDPVWADLLQRALEAYRNDSWLCLRERQEEADATRQTLAHRTSPLPTLATEPASPTPEATSRGYRLLDSLSSKARPQHPSASTH